MQLVRVFSNNTIQKQPHALFLSATLAWNILTSAECFNATHAGTSLPSRGFGTRCGRAEDGAAEIDLSPLKNNNRLRHLSIIPSKRSWNPKSSVSPPNVAWSSSTNL